MAQQNTVASGGDASGSGGSVSYSIGQIDYITESGSGGSATQGVQQPYEIFVGFEELTVDLQANLFPNPAALSVQLQFGNWTDFESPRFEMTDDRGRLLFSGEIVSAETSISLAELPNAPYFVRLIANETLVKNFKLVKNQ
ncbi:MAG: hypothetical protein A3D92_14225 [Bacteroidetes bacterium RIFCSPHIGHO2_02_FULL_44_7]|nr:MAG: hypothetical protein A3D92_14225 [Bacteroidetes bacterium RIFCSPHIGHO2_02_FULL_44_7]